ncbi:hypothetical protein EPO04_01495 [Patescibacteria group bacterium]|nr:MAG: hypothetical protein EPO04_01495 [Patescibacteria group bacterium]
MPRSRHILILIAVIGSLIAAPSALAGGSDGSSGGATYASPGPSTIIAPKGMYSWYVKQFYQVAAACNYSMSQTGTWTPDVTATYYGYVNAFSATRQVLNKIMARRHLGFAPSFEDWSTISRFQRRDGEYVFLSCPQG